MEDPHRLPGTLIHRHARPQKIVTNFNKLNSHMADKGIRHNLIQFLQGILTKPECHSVSLRVSANCGRGTLTDECNLVSCNNVRPSLYNHYIPSPLKKINVELHHTSRKGQREKSFFMVKNYSFRSRL